MLKASVGYTCSQVRHDDVHNIYSEQLGQNTLAVFLTLLCAGVKGGSSSNDADKLKRVNNIEERYLK